MFSEEFADENCEGAAKEVCEVLGAENEEVVKASDLLDGWSGSEKEILGEIEFGFNIYLVDEDDSNWDWPEKELFLSFIPVEGNTLEELDGYISDEIICVGRRQLFILSSGLERKSSLYGKSKS